MRSSNGRLLTGAGNARVRPLDIESAAQPSGFRQNSNAADNSCVSTTLPFFLFSTAANTSPGIALIPPESCPGSQGYLTVAKGQSYRDFPS
jgi:hypothetical protein